MAVDVEQRAPARPRRDDVVLPDLFVEGPAGHFGTNPTESAYWDQANSFLATWNCHVTTASRTPNVVGFTAADFDQTFGISSPIAFDEAVHRIANAVWGQRADAQLMTASAAFFGVTDTAWSVAANLTMPILDRPRLLAQIHAQKAVAEQNVIAYEKAVQTAYGDTETAFNYLQSDTRRVQMLTSAERRAESAYEKARVGYARGVNDLTAALQAETTWRSTRTQLTSAQTTQMQRSVQVFKALGGGWTPDQPAAGTPFAATAAKGVKGTVQTAPTQGAGEGGG